MSPSQVAVPAIGPRLPGLAFISAIKGIFKYDVMIEEGHRKVRRYRLSEWSFLNLALYLVSRWPLQVTDVDRVGCSRYRFIFQGDRSPS